MRIIRLAVCPTLDGIPSFLALPDFGTTFTTVDPSNLVTRPFYISPSSFSSSFPYFHAHLAIDAEVAEVAAANSEEVNVNARGFLLFGLID